MSINLRIEGLEAVTAQLERLGGDATKVASKTVTKTLVDIQRNAKRAAPVNDDRLRSSIAWGFLNPDKTEGEVGTNVAYARFVEFGVGPTGADSDFTVAAEQAMRELGYKHGPHGPFPPEEEIARWAHKHGIPEEAIPAIQFTIWQYGIEAQPFIFPASEAASITFIPRLQRELELILRRAS